MGKLRRFAIGLGIYFIVLFSVASALVAFCHPNPPKTMSSVTDPFTKMDLSDLPALLRYRARDNAQLSYRSYPGAGDQVVVLIHGSAGSSKDMHQMAIALQKETGATVLVPDLRGHGANLPHGDVAYDGQLDDDMADFITFLEPAYPGKKWTLLGFSSGGGFALRIAGESQARFDRYILLSPFLRYNAPTARQDAAAPSDGAHWYSVSIARIIGLSIFGFFGIHHFDGLPVLSFPVPSNIEATTSSYSFRLQKNFGPHDDYQADIRHISRPTQVFVGSDDELFLPDKFAQVFNAERRDVPVTILPGMTHADMITKPLAIHAIVQAVRQ